MYCKGRQLGLAPNQTRMGLAVAAHAARVRGYFRPVSAMPRTK